jgi:hypothetical protein
VIDAGSLDYAHARLCARFGDRPDALTWRRIETVRDIGAMLDTARTSALAVWIAGIAPDARPHAIERAMRAHWHERVAVMAAWMPSQWRASIEWCALLADLPVVQHLARGGASPRWLSDDPLRAALGDRRRRPTPGPSALLDAAGENPDRVAEIWRAEWERRLPDPRQRGSLLQETIRVVADHWRAFRDPRADDGRALRQALHARLSRLFRRATLDPAAAFIFLALSALDFERLRGEILRRVAFPRLPVAE